MHSHFSVIQWNMAGTRPYVRLWNVSFCVRTKNTWNRWSSPSHNTNFIHQQILEYFFLLENIPKERKLLFFLVFRVLSLVSIWHTSKYANFFLPHVVVLFRLLLFFCYVKVIWTNDFLECNFKMTSVFSLQFFHRFLQEFVHFFLSSYLSLSVFLCPSIAHLSGICFCLGWCLVKKSLKSRQSSPLLLMVVEN